MPDSPAVRFAVIGAGALLGGVPTDAATLRKNVTSPGGTTAAGLAVLMGEEGWQPLVDAAIAAARAAPPMNGLVRGRLKGQISQKKRKAARRSTRAAFYLYF